MAKTAQGYHTFNMRIDEDLLLFLKQTALNQGCSMTFLVSKCLSDYKKKLEKKLSKNEVNDKS